MKRGGKMLVCVTGGLAMCMAARGVTTPAKEALGNPYQSIIDRNVFSLKPPPPPPDPAEANKPQVLKITLTGITTIFGDKRVLMKTAPPPGKPGEGPKTEQSYILSEGQREGDIEVLAIDEKAGSVKVNNAGTVQTLTFEKDGAKLPSTPAPAGAPGAAAPIPGLPVNRPMVPGTPSFQLPSRIPRLPMPGGQASYTPGGVSPAVPFAGATPVGASPVTTTTPGFLPGNTTSTANPAPPPHTPQYTLEEQQIMIEAERQMGGPTAGLLPPTALSPHANVYSPPGSVPGGQQPVQQAPSMMLPPIPGRPMAPGPY